MRVLIFEPKLTGHHLEYLHHLYNGAIVRPKNEYFFAVPSKAWQQIKNKCQWKEAHNIQWIMLDDNECKRAETGSLLAMCYRLSVFIKRTSLFVNADEILLIDLAEVIPILPLILPRRIKLSGIIYNIYLRSPKRKLRKWLDEFRYSIMAHNLSMGKIFILNDSKSTDRLNQIYHTNKFTYLPDPVPEINQLKFIDIRDNFNIPPNVKVFLHFGAMDERKGTLLILRALCAMTRIEHSTNYFIFAGCVKSDIHDEFYSLVEKARNVGANIMIKDEFCSFDYINSLCHNADCILIPYLSTGHSSGVIGYAAVHNTPVIGPSKGLIGELIINNDLGQTINSITPSTIRDSILQFKPYILKTPYATYNTLKSFIYTLLN